LRVTDKRPGTTPVESANEVHFSAESVTDLVLTSPDVIHAFRIPVLGGKLDAIPGRETRFQLTPSVPGRCRGAARAGGLHGVPHGAGRGMVHVSAALDRTTGDRHGHLARRSQLLVSCVGAAVHCEKLAREAALDPVRIVVILVTAVGFALVGVSMRGLWRVRGRSLTDDDFDDEHNSPEERHRFLSHEAQILSALSAIGMIYVALPVFPFGSCR
jgi:hypothetical protein